MVRWTVTVFAVALATSTAFAAPTEEEISRLGGPELTPVGAERAGNAEGTIPEWTGGVTEPPPGWKPGILYDLVAGRYVITPAINEEEEGICEHPGMPAEARTIADDKGLFKPDDLRRMGRR